MATPASRKPIMTLFSGSRCIHSHSCRIVLFEKEVDCHIHYLETDGYPEDLQELNPYNETPTLVDRDLVLYDAEIINEYLDERLPHPPLMPVDPVNRGEAKLMVKRIERDWYGLVDDMEGASDRGTKRASKARKILRESILASTDVFGARDFFLSDEFSLVDCTIAPILWRLAHYGIELPTGQSDPILKYRERLFSRPSFQASLTELERELR